MDVVMFHSGDTFLKHLEDCFRQFRIFNPDVKVYFLTDRKWMNDDVFAKYNIDVLNKDEYYSPKVDLYQVYFKASYKPKDFFWIITALRFIYIENFMKAHKLVNMCHFENDIMIYHNINRYHDKFVKLYPSMAITVGGGDKCMTGFMFIKNFSALERMTHYFTELLRKYDKRKIIDIYGMDMVNEMTLMRAYSKDYPDHLALLPNLPFGEFSSNFEEFDSVFDPASFGQYIGGTFNGTGPGAKPEDHYIGQLLRQHPEYDVVWKRESRGIVPYFKYNGNEVRINNLHIHSKELHKYLSK
jgi:hypothetical protein